jgi:hypothetical protein
MHCPFCPPSFNQQSNTIWSYGFVDHVWDMHSPDGTLPHIPPAVWIESFVSQKEEQTHGIPSRRTAQWRDLRGALASEDIEARQGQDAEKEEEVEGFTQEEQVIFDRVKATAVKRDRSGTVVSTLSTSSTGPSARQKLKTE